MHALQTPVYKWLLLLYIMLKIKYAYYAAQTQLLFNRKDYARSFMTLAKIIRKPFSITPNRKT